jgi:uncharacterized protein YndB with AHSA1/START domain
MAAAQQESETTLQLRRTFAAPRAKVFEAWTQREKLEQWMCRDEKTHEVKYTELDVRPGGRYMMKIIAPKGISYDLGGVFREVKPPEKLVFTWSWKKIPAAAGEQSESGDTLVTVEFFERGNETEVVLTHELTPKAGPREAYDKGWKGCFDILATVLESARV